jgi:hypothetical protein
MLRNSSFLKMVAYFSLILFCSATLAASVNAAESPGISQNEQQNYLSEPEQIPVVSESKLSIWFWIIGGALVVGGGVAALAGGGGGGGGGSSPPPATTTATSSAAVTW